MRLDGGDAETGTGVEAGAGVSYAGDGVTVEGFVRGLVAHEERGYEEWGAGLSVDVEPGADGRGLSLSLAPSWGETANGTDRLWSADGGGDLAPGGAARLWSADGGGELASGEASGASRRLDAEVGYGLGAPGGRGVVTPWVGLELAEERSWRAGARWQLSPDIVLSLDGMRREPADDDASRHELTLRAGARWQLAPGVVLSLDGTRREPANDDAPEHVLMLRMEMRW